jgi:Flp pilus assembly protein TadG
MSRWKIVSEQHGGVAIMVAICAVVLLSFAALVVDIGYGLVVKNQLHNVADAAALAGTRQLGRIYCPEIDPANPCIPYDQQQSYVLTSTDRAAIVAEVLDTAQKNSAGGVSITVNDGDIRIGDWDIPTRTFTPTATRPTAVEVTARRDGSANGPISTFLGNIMGVSTLSVRATSVRNGQPEEPTAALTGVSYAPPGELDIPVAISRKWFTGGEGAFCGQSIKFSPTTDPEACGGWTTFTNPKANDPIIQGILNGLRTGTYQTPGVTAGETELTMINGDLSTPTFDALEALYNAKKDADGTWKTFVPVYDSDTCHPNKSEELIVSGFATVLITQVLGAPDKLIQGTVLCDVIEPARGGGAEFGTLGSIPSLVQ